MIVDLLATVAYYALLLYFFVLWGRFIIDLVRGVNRSWRPTGFTLVLVELVYTFTDPPVRFFRKLIPPLSIGPIQFDFGFTITMLCCIVGMSIASFVRASF